MADKFKKLEKNPEVQEALDGIKQHMLDINPDYAKRYGEALEKSTPKSKGDSLDRKSLDELIKEVNPTPAITNQDRSQMEKKLHEIGTPTVPDCKPNNSTCREA